jgi:starch synthase
MMVTAEYAPLAKVGGLGDMTASLCGALASRGHDVRVVLPLYADIDREEHAIRRVAKYPPFIIRVGQRVVQGRLFVKGSTAAKVKVYLVENQDLFGTPGIYTYAADSSKFDSLARMALHNQAALSLPTMLDWSPQVLHCHDAQTALAILYFKYWYRRLPAWQKAESLLTIHNLAYQEAHPASVTSLLGFPEAMSRFPGPLEFHGQANLLKAGIMEANLVNTVSPTYAREVVSNPQLGHSLGTILKARGAAFSGVLNGADLVTWDPARDPLLTGQYDATNLTGKQKCREDLLTALALSNGRRPVVGMVSRLVEQKGVDLVVAALDWLVEAGFCLVVLGTGEERFQTALSEAADRHPRYMAYVKEFDEALAHRIMAGSDMFLVPSLYEPCGLTQMYALRYGSVPIVRHTGGLADTVRDASRSDGTGFVFHDYTPAALQSALSRALTKWRERGSWTDLMRRGMAKDFSWDESAAEYEKLYARLTEQEEELA